MAGGGSFSLVLLLDRRLSLLCPVLWLTFDLRLPTFSNVMSS